MNPEQKEVLRHFHDTVIPPAVRGAHYVVQMKFRPDGQGMLGQSCPSAKAMLRHLIRRLQKTGMMAAYNDIIDDSIARGHVEKVDPITDDRPHFYMSHHHVVKETSSSTPIRIVFNGSMPSSTGLSLNDVLMDPRTSSTVYGMF